MTLDRPRSPRTQTARAVTQRTLWCGVILGIPAIFMGNPGWYRWGIQLPVAVLLVLSATAWVVFRWRD